MVWPSLTTRHGLSWVVALAVVAAAVLLRWFDLDPVAGVRNHGFDLLQQRWPRAISETPWVAIVEIDDKSLSPRHYGQWPWPRTLLAALVQRIAEGKPRALGIDILFDEPDRLSPDQVARKLAGLPPATVQSLEAMPSNDTALAAALKRVPTVLATAPDRPAGDAETGQPDPLNYGKIGGDPRQYLPTSGPLPPLVPVLAGAAHAGSIAYYPDPDGVIRRIPLAVTLGERVIPSFDLELLRLAAHAFAVTFNVGEHGIESLGFSGLTIPTDPNGNALPHFGDTPREKYYKDYYVSAADILDHKYDVGRLRGRIVLIGVTALGLLDERQIPLGQLVQGIDIHAQLIDSMIDGALLRRPWSMDWIELNVLLAAGLLTIWVLPYHRPPRALALALGLVALLIGTELALFRFAGLLFDASFPVLTVLAALGVMLVSALRAAQTALMRERELRQRQEGELAAAQAIQMGLLPREHPPFPDRPDIDLSARIEPARMVGGDFYEYMLVDHGRRLFFLIADVSDKGIPAALFMAMTKEIVHDAVLRFAPSLERIFTEVNRRTTEASRDLPAQGGDMMFVTAFAGILDLQSGEVTYASAGHDPPFVVGGDAGPRRLQTEGGPPFGAIDPFPFPVDHDRLAPGQVLVLFTDGVTEAQNAERALYSGARLERLLQNVTTTGTAPLIEAIVADLRRFVGKSEPADDITLLAVRRAG